ncbi:MAG: hypothetical protein CVV63_02535, partial [Tenericutes bacterium HGW-Tenericutes-8]
GSLFMFLLGVGNPNKEHIRALYPIPLLIILMIFVKQEPLYVAGGAYMGLSIGYYIEKLYVKSKVSAPVLIQVVKVLVGIVVALAIKEGLKFVFPYSGNVDIDPTNLDLIFDFIRYFLIAIWASLGLMYVNKKVLGDRIK